MIERVNTIDLDLGPACDGFLCAVAMGEMGSVGPVFVPQPIPILHVRRAFRARSLAGVSFARDKGTLTLCQFARHHRTVFQPTGSDGHVKPVFDHVQLIVRVADRERHTGMQFGKRRDGKGQRPARQKRRDRQAQRTNGFIRQPVQFVQSRFGTAHHLDHAGVKHPAFVGQRDLARRAM